ncbi:MAG TPA: Holliday junction branch migration protein RuvA [candidate division Zixibacteria bacterium]|jgi:Holliday junction DNA helicase RuvA|nr:Holliday junction branch migration protein RuvA [candidate division Zixibacteria bacterium]
MYHHIKGTLVSKNPAEAVIEAGGVGYLLRISLNTYQALPEAGNQTRLLCHLHVKEDAHQLYGFAAERERQAFRIMIGISGVGPKLAMTVLSRLSPHDLEQAVAQQDMTMLTSISGVGRKTAERLLIELKGRLAEAVVDGLPAVKGQAAPGDPAAEALMTLGLSLPEARSAVERARSKLGAGADIGQLVREALKQAK